MESQIYETLIIPVVFAAIFFFGAWLRIPGKQYHRRLISFAAGISVAYVFVRLIPGLQMATETYINAKGHVQALGTMHRVYLAAMIGFIVFYGLEHLVISSRSTAASEATSEKAITPVFLLHIAGFAIYAWLLTYLLLHTMEGTIIPVFLYSFTMGWHLLAIDHSLRREHGPAYARLGKNILTVAVLLGWIVGVLTELPVSAVVLLFGFVSGAVIMNSMIMELPREKEGKFIPFLLGGIVYAWLLLIIA